MIETEPQWLSFMRSLEGAQFLHGGGGERLRIHGWLDFIAQQYPEMASYCAALKSQTYFAWCGLTVAYCMARCGIRPVFGRDDYHRFAWAPAWQDFGASVTDPQPGDIVVFGRDGLEHVTLFVRQVDENHWECLGGNQGPDQKVRSRDFPKHAAVAIRRPPPAQIGAGANTQDERDIPPPHESWNTSSDADLPQSVAGMPPDFILLAQASQRKWGVPASVTLAQAIVESAGGRKMPANSFNPFGITTTGRNRGVFARTQEEIHGQRQTMTRSFRVFSSFAEAFDVHGELLAKHYPEAMRFKDDPLQFVQNLKRYATASNYGSALRNAILKYNLLQFDVASEGGVVKMEGMILSMGSTGPVVKALQEKLSDLGYWPGGIDGEYGTFTQGAVLQFQVENGLEADGVVGSETFAALERARSRALPRERTEATIEDLAKWGSRIVLNGNRNQLAGLISLVLGALGIGNSIAVGFPAKPLPTGGAPAISPEILQSPTKGFDTVKAAVAANNKLTDGQAKDVLAFVQSLVDHAKSAAPQPSASVNTVVDYAANWASAHAADLPAPLQMGIQALAAAASSTLPGFGGSLLAVGLGLAARFFGQQINNARLDDHKKGINLKNFPNS